MTTRYTGAIFLGHDSTFTIYDKIENKFKIVELDKLVDKKHYRPRKNNYKVAADFYKNYLVSKNFPPKCFDTILLKHSLGYQNDLNAQFDWLKKYTNSFYFTRDNMRSYRHHLLHAWSSYFQSPFSDAYVITWDGTGDFKSNSFTGFKNQKQVFYEENSKFYGYIYEYVGRTFSSLADTGNSLDYAGKVMGLSAYGRSFNLTAKFQHLLDEILNEYDDIKHRPLAYEKIFSFFSQSLLNPNLNITDLSVHFDTIRNFLPLHALKSTDNIKYDRHFLYGSEEMDYAWTVQNWLENKLLEMIDDKKEEIKKYNNNLILSGGVALNVLANQKAKETFQDINFYVPPNPSDCGLSLGMLVKYLAENDNINFKNYTSLLYSGMELEGNINDYPHWDITFNDLLELIKKKKIIGLLQGQCETGPRALGNRSIICLPTYGMKKKINDKVKFREWFRPFAPVCTPEMANKYFISNDFNNMESMAYTVKVNPLYKKELASITHVDGTARLQIVNEKDNVFLYKIINTLNTPLLNTSFNVQGKPILNSFKQSIKVLNDTELDYVIYWDGKTIKCLTKDT